MTVSPTARRYRPGERTQLTAHRDVQSIVTAVIELAPAQPQPESGGLYIKSEQASQPNFPALRAVKPNCAVPCTCLIVLEEASHGLVVQGDAFLHGYDLLHGVHINCPEAGCARHSLVLWFQEDATKCDSGGEVEQAE